MRGFLLIILLCGLAAGTGAAGTITYQGSLEQSGTPYTGTARLVFALAEDEQSAPFETLDPIDVEVVDGLFQVELEFSSEAFATSPRWLEVSVDGTMLGERQKVTAVPFALNAGQAGGDSIWSLTGSNVTYVAGNVGIGVANPAQRLQVSGSVILGRPDNSASIGDAFVSGGFPFNPNSAGGQSSFVGGGFGNTTDATAAFIGGGRDNTASGAHSFVAGGRENTAEGANSIVLGGVGNTASGDFSFASGGDFEPDTFPQVTRANIAQGTSSFVGGGISNEAAGDRSFVAGGASNRANANNSFVSGQNNRSDGIRGFIGGGTGNRVFNGSDDAFIGAGRDNSASGRGSFIGGGWENTASGIFSAVAGGLINDSMGRASFVAGGEANRASGDYSFVTGFDSHATGLYSFAAGRLARSAHQGSFVWADSQNQTFNTLKADQFLIRAQGGVGIGTNNTGSFRLAVAGDAAKTGGGSWAIFSDSRLKTDIRPISQSGESLLDRLMQLSGYTFYYRPEAIESRLGKPGKQIGLLAQEVLEVFPDWVDEDDEGYLYVTERATTAIMVEALRELRETHNLELAALQKENQVIREQLHAAVETIDAAQAELSALQAQSHRLDDLLVRMASREPESDDLSERLAALESLMLDNMAQFAITEK